MEDENILFSQFRCLPDLDRESVKTYINRTYNLLILLARLFFWWITSMLKGHELQLIEPLYFVILYLGRFNANPFFRTLQRFAAELGMKMKSLVPTDSFIRTGHGKSTESKFPVPGVGLLSEIEAWEINKS